MQRDIKAVVFDVFGTLVDWRSGVAAVLAPSFRLRGIDIDPFAAADAWRSEYQPAMERIRAGNREYVPLDTIHRENLDKVLDRLGIGDRFDDNARAELNHAWERLPPWPDVVPGLAKLRRTRFLAPCSNGSIALMTRLARYAGFDWDAILGADIARDYKPVPAVYRATAGAFGLAPDRVMMVAAHADDLRAAAACGLRTGFVPRPAEFGMGGEAETAADDEFDFAVAGIDDLAAALDG